MSQRSKKPEGGDARDYEVGYGKPPRHSQFKPGNPGPRKGGGKSVPQGISCADLAERLLTSKTKARRGDKIVEIGVAEIIQQRLLAMATQGSMKEVSQLLTFLERYAPRPVADESRLDIVHHQALSSTVPLPPADLWEDPS